MQPETINLQSKVSDLIEFVQDRHFDETWNFLIPVLRGLLQEPKKLVTESDPLDLYRILAAVASFETLAIAFSIVPDEHEEFQGTYRSIREQLVTTLRDSNWAEHVDFVQTRLTWAERSNEIRAVIESTNLK